MMVSRPGTLGSVPFDQGIERPRVERRIPKQRLIRALASAAGTISTVRMIAAALGHPDVLQTFTPFAKTLSREAIKGHPIAMGGKTAVTIILSAAAIILLYARRDTACQVTAFAATLLPMVALIPITDG
jgi:hypothetical protein